MIIDGKEYERDRKGFYRCPYPDCHHPDYPARKFKTDAGFIKHLGECKARPDGSGVWHNPPDPPEVLWGICPDCGKEISLLRNCFYLPPLVKRLEFIRKTGKLIHMNTHYIKCL